MELSHLNQDPTSDVVHCPFNPTHAMLRKTLVLHLTKCPDKKKVKQDNSNTCVKGDTAINQNQCMIKPPLGLTRGERKKIRNQASQQYANIDLSYNPNLSIHNRQSSTTSNGGNTANQSKRSTN